MHRDTFHQLYYHITWTTKRRLPFLEHDTRRGRLVEQVREAAARHGGHVLACNAMPDHVHLLVSLPPIDLAQYIGRVKGASSHHFNKEFGPAHTLYWQDGYGVVSLRASDTETVVRYIEDQEAIHAARAAAGPCAGP